MHTFDHMSCDVRRRLYTIALLIFLIIASLALCGCSGGGGGGGNGGTFVDVNTLDGQTGIATDSKFRYTFQGSPNASTVTTTSYFIVPTPASAQVAKAAYDPTICNSDNAIGATVSAASTHADLEPSHVLSGGTNYTICLSSDITVGTQAFSGFMATFTTVGGGTQTERFRITNNCSYTVWIQQQNMPASTPQIVKLAAGAHQDYEIPDTGQNSTRFWPKKGCDDSGNNCEIGQTLPPCPTDGCAPAIDSKFEATWGCTLSDQSQCVTSGPTLTQTVWDTSAVDGYTLPFMVSVESNDNPSGTCVDVDCSGLNFTGCPTDENLSQGETTTHPEYANSNLQAMDGSNGTTGCFSTCSKFTSGTNYGGYNISNESDAAIMYCCPTPPITSEQCQGGPVAGTQYVAAIHQMCPAGAYAYAYDDGIGQHWCLSAVKVEWVLGPNCP